MHATRHSLNQAALAPKAAQGKTRSRRWFLAPSRTTSTQPASRRYRRTGVLAALNAALATSFACARASTVVFSPDNTATMAAPNAEE
jgi:hypothetical protein